jgi:hypothetical protein
MVTLLGHVRRLKAASLQLRASSSEVIDVLDVASRLSAPAIGEERVSCAEGMARVQVLCTELLAGSLAEEIAFPGVVPLSAQHDQDEAFALAGVASLVPTAFLELCRAEALAILVGNIDVLRALAAELVERGELSGEEVDQVISAAVTRRQLAAEHARRADRRRRMESASAFQRELSIVTRCSNQNGPHSRKGKPMLQNLIQPCVSGNPSSAGNRR